MTARSSATQRPRIVGMIASRADLVRALRMRNPPDLFELRLDRLAIIVDQLENKLSRLRAPLIITARHPQEGGGNKLSLRQRRDVLTRFLTHAEYVDVELRSASALRSLLRLATQKKVRRIISFHNFKSTPPLRVLCAKARAAKTHGADIFKVATSPTHRATRASARFHRRKDIDLPVSAMGIGKLGVSRSCSAQTSRLWIRRRRADIEGQLSPNPGIGTEQ
jgi:3-dehydroquinate dehydratase-1